MSSSSSKRESDRDLNQVIKRLKGEPTTSDRDDDESTEDDESKLVVANGPISETIHLVTDLLSDVSSIIAGYAGEELNQSFKGIVDFGGLSNGFGAGWSSLELMEMALFGKRLSSSDQQREKVALSVLNESEARFGSSYIPPYTSFLPFNDRQARILGEVTGKAEWSYTDTSASIRIDSHIHPEFWFECEVPRVLIGCAASNHVESKGRLSFKYENIIAKVQGSFIHVRDMLNPHVFLCVVVPRRLEIRD
jgi:hypothetical protein